MANEIDPGRAGGDDDGFRRRDGREVKREAGESDDGFQRRVLDFIGAQGNFQRDYTLQCEGPCLDEWAGTLSWAKGSRGHFEHLMPHHRAVCLCVSQMVKPTDVLDRLAAAKAAWSASVNETCDRVRDGAVIPLCERYGLSFVSCNGEYTFHGDGVRVCGLDPTLNDGVELLPEGALGHLSVVYALLDVEVGHGDRVGHRVTDYQPGRARLGSKS